MAALRTKIALTLVIVNIIIVYSDSEIKPTYGMDKDSLLRGSGEERDKTLEEDIALPDKHIEPERSLKEELNKGTTDKTVQNIEDMTTTEVVTTTDTEEIPEALGLRIPDVKGVKEETEEKNEDYFEVSRKDDAATTVDATDATETATDTLSMIDNNVYISNVSNDNIESESKAPLTSATPQMESSSTETTRPIEEMAAPGPSLVGFADDLESSGQRSPKTDKSEPKQENARKFEPKPELPPAASKSSTLKGWLEDSWLRPPAGILVPLRPMALNRALAVWNDLTVDGLNLTDIVIVGYDSNGVNWRSRHNLQPTSTSSGDRAVSEALSKLLLKYQGVNTDTASDGTMRALASAAKLVPYDSALFVVTDKGAGDAHRLPLALRALVEKRLKVYTIWTDPNHPSSESELQLQELRNISQHTEGEVLPYSLQVMDMDSTYGSEQWEQMDVHQSRQGRVSSLVAEDELDKLLVRRGGGEAISLGVPVENGVTALRIYIEGLVEHAVLYPPNDAPQVDLYNISSVRAFSPLSSTDRLTPRDISLVFPGANPDQDMLSVLPMTPSASDASAPTVGLWHLSVRCDTCDYRLCVTARTQIHFEAAVEPKDMLKLRVTGPVASVRESVLIDEYGTELAKLPFSYQPTAGDGQSPSDAQAELVEEVALPNVKGSRVYAKIVGRDVRGEPFVRFSGPLNSQEVRMGRSASIAVQDSLNDLEQSEALNSKAYQQLRYNESTVLPNNRAMSQVVNHRGSLLTSVQIGMGTRLYGSPGDNLQLHFEVTNFREQTVRFRFEAIGELRFLDDISPRAQTIPSGQTLNVIVFARIANQAQPGARDLVTFTAYGLEQVSISAYIYVVNPQDTTADVWAPELRHNFQGTCIGRLGSDCAQFTWSANVIARDAVGGLLRLSSSPLGLAYDSNFIAGSRDEVIAIYRATCCAPRVMITAVDAFGNANSYVIDISNYFTEAGIAAIVLGVILLIAIIAIVVFLIYCCVKRRRESRELPTYTTSSRNV